MNLCVYVHPKYICGGETKQNRQCCKFFPSGKEECPHYNKYGCQDCDLVSAQFEAWAALEKP